MLELDVKIRKLHTNNKKLRDINDSKHRWYALSCFGMTEIKKLPNDCSSNAGWSDRINEKQLLREVEGIQR